MDNLIYRPTAQNLGIYATRRYPKGALGAQPAADVPVNVSKPNYSDASIKTGVLAAGQGNGAGANVIIASYLVPPLRRAEIQNAIVTMTRRFAAAPASVSSVQLRLTRKGQTSSIKIVFAYRTLAAVGDWQDSVCSTGPIDLYEGDLIEALWSDDSTGGNVEFTMSATIIEYASQINYVPGNNDAVFQPFQTNATPSPVSAAAGGGGGSAPSSAPAPWLGTFGAVPTSGLLK